MEFMLDPYFLVLSLYSANKAIKPQHPQLNLQSFTHKNKTSTLNFNQKGTMISVYKR